MARGGGPALGHPADLRLHLLAGRSDPGLGGLRFIDVFVPSLVVITVGTLGIQTLPVRLATYREKGVLRRLATTPAHPMRLLTAQLVTYLVTALVALVLLVVVARIAFDVPLPPTRSATSRPSCSAPRRCSWSGLVLAAVAPSARTATAVAIPLFFVVMFLGGVYVPRAALPDVLVRIGEFTPPGVQGLQDAWVGNGPQLAPLVVMAVVPSWSACSRPGRSGGSERAGARHRASAWSSVRR